MESKAIANIIYEQILKHKEQLILQYEETKSGIGYFYIDKLLPEALAHKCFQRFPEPSQMKRLKSIREYKYVSAQMNQHDTFLEAVIYAFQDERVIKILGEICQIEELEPDDSLYAGGLSLMGYNNFLNPHLDNSHDAERARWRVLNALYYVSPDWTLDHGGHLELWPEGPKKNPVVIESKFNRLILMATHQDSWHSVNKVKAKAHRCCISNYYFSEIPLKSSDKFHITKFRGRPHQTITNFVLDCDASLRMLIRKVFKKGIRKNPHYYKNK